MAPYRSRREDEPPLAPAKTGLVADMVRQFADPYAFLRELVQNGIDAGSTSIEVRIEALADGLLATSVTDDGCGMTREVIEGPLLTLFSSSKEGDSKKIGKYGVGFVSIFALEPDEVQVSTGCDGESWLLRLFPDHSYELEAGGPRTVSGTSVTLLKRINLASSMPAGDDVAIRMARLALPEGCAMAEERSAFEKHEALVLSALKTWCRHALCPITLTVVPPERPEGARRSRIDTPIAVISPLSVTETTEEETFVVGPSAGARHPGASIESACEPERSESFAGFYNRGLTLFETDQALSEGLRGIRFKVLSPHLQHTLSRDNVRRDDAFERVMERVSDIAQGSLKSRILHELGRYAELASGGEGESEYIALLEAALSPPLSCAPREIAFPLTDPVNGEKAMRNVRGNVSYGEPILWATEPDALTAALARAGTFVVRCSYPTVQDALQRCFPKLHVVSARHVHVLVTELNETERTKQDLLLFDEMRLALKAAGETVARVALCRLDGSGTVRPAVTVPDEDLRGPQLYSIESIESWWSRWGWGRALLLNADSEPVKLARARAATDCALGAHLLARVLLLKGDRAIASSVNERLLEHAGKGLQ